jgi:hypothetical protein
LNVTELPPLLVKVNPFAKFPQVLQLARSLVTKTCWELAQNTSFAKLASAGSSQKKLSAKANPVGDENVTDQLSEPLGVTVTPDVEPSNVTIRLLEEVSVKTRL